MSELGTVRWTILSEYSGNPLYSTRDHYVGEKRKTLCGLDIPRHDEGRVEVDYSCGMSDPCQRCSAAEEKASKA